MSAETDTTTRLLKILRPRLRLLAAGADLPLDEDLGRLGLDSLESIDLLMDLEAEFGAPIPEEKITVETFTSARNLLRVIEDAAA